MILQINDNQFHIDPGPGALVRAVEYGVKLRANTSVLVSHTHLRHCNDVNAVIDAMTYRGFDKKGVLVCNKTLMNGEKDYQPYLLKFYRDCLERFIVLEPGQKVGINEVDILALKAKHSEPNTIGFKFFTPQYTLTYSADTKYHPELVEEYKNSNILILNVLAPKKEQVKDHLSSEDAVKLIKAVNPRLAIIQHFGIEMLKADPIYEAREIQKQTNVQTIAAKDGMVINPISYSVDQGQRTLYAYPKKEVAVEVREIKAEEEPKESREEKDKSLKDVFLEEDSKEES